MPLHYINYDQSEENSINEISSSSSKDSLICIDKPIEDLDFSDKPLLIAGLGSQELTESIHRHSNLELCDIKVGHFWNGETMVNQWLSEYS